MSCQHWRTALIEKVYDEIAPSKADELQAHLDGCPACRRMLRNLSGTRAALAGAAPAVPDQAPRVVVLGRTAARPGWLAFAAGFLAAVILLGAGFVAGTRLDGGAMPDAGVASGLPVDADPSESRPVTRAELESVLGDYSSRFSDRLARQEQVMQRFAALPADSIVTQDDFQRELSQFGETFDLRVTSGLEDVRDQVQAIQLIYGRRLGETEKVLGYILAVNQPDPER